MSHIKGGGRASLSEQAQEDLALLLLSIRNPHKSSEISTQHAKKHECKSFVKKLIKQHERRTLAAKVNASDNRNGDELSLNVSNQLKIVQGGQGDSVPATVAAGNSTKVRIELIEAIFAAATKKKSSSTSSSSSSKKSSKSSSKDKKGGPEFKEGSKKIMVLSRQSTVEQVMKEAKTKLHMKKKPTRCFVVENKVTVVLNGTLSGLSDGTKVYVTSQQDPPSEEATTPNDDEKDLDSTTPNEKEAEVDPLDSVKQAYKRRKRSRNGKRQSTTYTSTGGEHPTFGDCLDKLPILSQERAKLPAASSRQAFLTALDDQRVLIVCGATGSGKSTQIPPYILEGMRAAGQEERAHILVTQPRRVAAMSLAQRVAHELRSRPPGTPNSLVGYSVRLDRAVSATAKIVYCTVGILLRMLVCPKEHNDDFLENDNPENGKNVPLSKVTHVVIDEVHERDINTDFVLTLLRRVLVVNKNLRVILMSATASASLFVDYFEQVGMTPSIIEIPGRTFPVTINWISACEQFAGSSVLRSSTKKENTTDTQQQQQQQQQQDKTLSPRATEKIDNGFIGNLIKAICQKQHEDGELSTTNGEECFRQTGGILVFLPGKSEIEALARTLSGLGLGLCKVFKLHSAVPKEQQQSVFVPARVGTIKVVLATNIAETSITIPDVSHVIDTGRVKESRFNVSTRIKELVMVWTSQASAKQRAGRAGRTSAGTCWRLYDEPFFDENFLPQTCPEILRSPIDELVMQISLLYEQKRDENKDPTHNPTGKGVCPVRFLSNTPEPPEEDKIVQACQHLLEVGALRVVACEPRVLYRLTPLGYHLSRLPMDAKVGKVLLVGCMLGCLDNALTVAAALSITKSCFPTRFTRSKDVEWENCLQARKDLVETGFGGPRWIGAGSKNVVKGDLTATIAAYRKWKEQHRNKDRAMFCSKHGIDNLAMQDLHSLRSQFLDCLVDGGFVNPCCNEANDDALLTSCCLVAGLYPNVCTLMRPRRGGPKGGRLITKEQEMCKTSSSSFQTQRLKNASETGKDAYAVFHSKHRNVGTGERAGEVFLSEVDFVSRFALLLFGGELVIDKNALIVDSWLKFKIGDQGSDLGALVLIQELRVELDNLLIAHMGSSNEKDDTMKKNDESGSKDHSLLLIDFVRKLLAEE